MLNFATCSHRFFRNPTINTRVYWFLPVLVCLDLQFKEQLLSYKNVSQEQCESGWLTPPWNLQYLDWQKLDWTELHFNNLAWTGSDGIRSDWIRSDWIRIRRTGFIWILFVWPGLDWIFTWLDSMDQDWIGLVWSGLNWTKMDWIMFWFEADICVVNL